MIIYVEYLFMENFITGLLILYLTDRLLSKSTVPVRWLRMIFGAVLCGLSGFILFLPLEVAEGILLRCLLAAVVCAAALGRVNLLKKTAIFLIISFLSGGVTMALFLWQQIPALSGNGVLYMETMTYLKLLGCGIPAMVGSCWFIRQIKKQRKMDRTCGEVKLDVEGRSFRLRAFVDTGNCLREPVTGKPVILVDKKGSRYLGFSPEDYPVRFTVIPYKAVGTENGLLKGIRLDRMDFEGKQAESVVLAWYEGSFDGFEVLLNQELLEGGLLEHV